MFLLAPPVRAKPVPNPRYRKSLNFQGKIPEVENVEVEEVERVETVEAIGGYNILERRVVRLIPNRAAVPWDGLR